MQLASKPKMPPKFSNQNLPPKTAVWGSDSELSKTSSKITKEPLLLTPPLEKAPRLPLLFQL